MSETETQASLPLDRAPHGGWFRVEEAAIRKLKATFDSPASFRKAQLAYMVLLRIANLEGSDTFSRRVASLADDFGYNYDEAAQALKLVQQAGLLEITQQTVPGSRELAPSRYRVVRMFPEIPATFPDNPATLPGKEARFPEIQKPDQSPRVSKNSPKNAPRTFQREAHPKSQQEIYDYLLTLKIEASDAVTDAEYLWLHWTENNFTNGGKPIKSWKLTVSKWKAAGFLQSQKRVANHALGNGKKPSGLRDDQTF